MKKGVVLLLLASLGLGARAQVLIAIVFGDKLNTDKLEFGLVVSPSLTNITGMTSSYKPALSLGLYFNIKMSERLFLSPEAIAKSAFGAKGIPPYPTGSDSLDKLFAGGSVQRNIQSMSLPLLVHYRLVKTLFAEGGVQVDLMLQAKDDLKTKLNGNPLHYTAKVTDQFTRIDLGVTGGLLYKFKQDKGMGLGIRYFHGLTDTYKTMKGSQVNSVWLLNVTIPIGSSKPSAPNKANNSNS